MTLRRYAPIAQSRGTVIPPQLRIAVLNRDQGCIGPAVGMPDPCYGSLELDHVRASHGIGMKSRTEMDNLVTLCGGHHRTKTEGGRVWRPILIEYLSRVEDPHSHHVDPCPSCPPRHYLGDGWTHIGDANYPYSEVLPEGEK